MKTDSHMIKHEWHISDTSGIKGYLDAFCGDAYNYHFTDDHKLIPSLEQGKLTMKLTYIGVEEIRGIRQLTWEFEYMTRDEIPYTKWFKSRQEGEAFMQLFKSQLREIQAQKRQENKAYAESMAQRMAVIIERNLLQEEIQENQKRLRQLEYC